jgi:hypothetical protein
MKLKITYTHPLYRGWQVVLLPLKCREDKGKEIFNWKKKNKDAQIKGASLQD